MGGSLLVEGRLEAVPGFSYPQAREWTGGEKRRDLTTLGTKKRGEGKE